MARFIVIKTFRDKETGHTIKTAGSSYVSDNEKWTEQLIKEGYLKSSDKKSSTINNKPLENAVVETEVEKAIPKTTRKKPTTRKKSGE